MDEEKGNSFTPILIGLMTFLVSGTVVFYSINRLFVGAEDEIVTIVPFGTYPVVQVFFVVGMFTAFTLGVIGYLGSTTRSKLRHIVDAKTEELIQSRDFFLKLFEESPVPYLMVEKDATILLPNKAAQRLFGRTADELREFKFYEMNAGVYQELSLQIHEKFTRGVAVSDAEVQIVKENGVKRWVRMSALPFKAYGGKSKGGVVSFFDITEQKAIDKVKTEFVSLASHQLRTPLSAMKWYGEMMLSGDYGTLNEKQTQYLEKIYSGNERMIELVNLLLSASRLELGSLKIDIEQVNVVEMVKGMLEELSKLIQDKNLHVIEQYSGEVEAFCSDKKLLLMIVQNLLSNAAKYTNESGEIRVRISREEGELLFEVEDNGLGIPDEQQDKVFTKMFRADNARLQVTDGTGLGLYIVKQAVEALGGEIGFTSKQNEGTIFRVSLPEGEVASNT